MRLPIISPASASGHQAEALAVVTGAAPWRPRDLPRRRTPVPRAARVRPHAGHMVTAPNPSCGESGPARNSMIVIRFHTPGTGPPEVHEPRSVMAAAHTVQSNG